MCYVFRLFLDLMRILASHEQCCRDSHEPGDEYRSRCKRVEPGHYVVQVTVESTVTLGYAEWLDRSLRMTWVLHFSAGPRCRSSGTWFFGADCNNATCTCSSDVDGHVLVSSLEK